MCVLCEIECVLCVVGGDLHLLEEIASDDPPGDVGAVEEQTLLCVCVNVGVCA